MPGSAQAPARARLQALRDASREVSTHAPQPSGRPGVTALPALHPVVPELPAGALVSVSGTGAASLGTALLAGACQERSWAAVVGIPEFGVRAAAGMGADIRRLLLADSPNRHWAETIAALTEGVDLVLTHAPSQVNPALARRLTALARRNGCVLVVAGQAWEGTWLHLTITESMWDGLAHGHGHLRGRRARVVARGRGSGEGRQVTLWLPGPDGAVHPLGDEAEPALPPRPLRSAGSGRTGVA